MGDQSIEARDPALGQHGSPGQVAGQHPSADRHCQLLAAGQGGAERGSITIRDADQHDPAAWTRRQQGSMEGGIAARRLENDVEATPGRVDERVEPGPCAGLTDGLGGTQPTGHLETM